MSNNMLYIRLLLFFFSVSLAAFSQEQDTVIYHSYRVVEDMTLDIDFQHTQLNIIPSEKDSISIHTHIRLIPTKLEAPYAGITLNTNLEDSNYISTIISIGEDIQPINELESTCEIHIPQNTNLRLNSQYGIINISASIGKLNANIAYTNLTIDTSQNNELNITSEYSTLKLKDINKINIKGKNSNLKANHISHLNANSEFSVFNIIDATQINSTSYSDKYIIGTVDSILISSKKALCIVDDLNLFFQGEMTHGSLIIKNIKPSFEAINISNSYVTSNLNFEKGSRFSINADMRYCLLKQKQLTLQEIVSPNSVLYHGHYGQAKDNTSNLSIISSYGDISLSIK